MCKEIIYFCAELLNYWTLMFWGLKFFIRVYRYDLSVSKEENNFIYLMIYRTGRNLYKCNNQHISCFRLL